MGHFRTTQAHRFVPGISRELRWLIDLAEYTHGGKARGRGAARHVSQLRAALPEELVRCFDHVAEHGRVPVATVTESGSCGSCHLQLPSGMASRLNFFHKTIHHCPHCGCFLYSARALKPWRGEHLGLRHTPRLRH
jgi:hypothetical protein